MPDAQGPVRRITVPAERRSIEGVRECVRASAAAAGLPSGDTTKAILAVEEACVNIIDHAYAGRAGGPIEVSCEPGAGLLTIRIRDQGRTFDPTLAPAPDLGRNIGERSVGGLGIHLIRSLMDEVRFEAPAGGGNLLTLVKRATRGDAGDRAP